MRGINVRGVTRCAGPQLTRQKAVNNSTRLQLAEGPRGPFVVSRGGGAANEVAQMCLCRLMSSLFGMTHEAYLKQLQTTAAKYCTQNVCPSL